MSRSDSEHVKLDVSLGREPGTGVNPDDPFRILIAGDFGASVDRATATAIKPAPVDRDNFEDVFRSMKVELEMPVAGRLRFGEFDDFHPDRCLETLSLFDRLREARELPDTAPRSAVAPPAPATSPIPFEFDSLLDDAISATESKAESRRARDPLRAWLDEQVEPYREPAAGRQSASRRELVDSVISAQMRALLHYPAFQNLEALWTMVHFLVRRLDTDSQLRLYLLDTGGENQRQLEKWIEGGDWAVIAVAARFGPSEADLQLLGSLGRAAARRHAILLADASPQLIGCDSFSQLPEPSRWAASSETWSRFRRSSAASSIGLVLPRILMRQPYGARTSSCSLFAFEEMGAEFDASRLLWGSGALAAVALLGEAFSAAGWRMRPDRHQDLDRLPLYVHGSGPAAFAVPCAETWMSMEAAEAILERGPMVLASIKDSDRVKMARFQSIADPPAPLAGRW